MWCINVTTKNESCGNANGSIDIVSASGGTAPYTYSVNGSPFSSDKSYTGLSAGTYIVQVIQGKNIKTIKVIKGEG